MNHRILIASSIFLILGILIGSFSFYFFNNKNSNTNILNPNNNCKYKFLNPLTCNFGISKSTKQYTSLRNEIINYINDSSTKKNADEVSVYFRDLKNGTTMSINAQDSFFPASLLKVPLLMMYYKKAETDPNVLKRKITINGDLKTKKQNIIPQIGVIPGQAYSIDELLNLLITQSDNGAWAVLLDDLDKNHSTQDFLSTLNELGIIDPNRQDQDQVITTQAYASIFRSLYESSYLNSEMSERALELLSESIYKNGIVAGVPQGTVIAHKFGEQSEDKTQLHDCGIIYFDKNPYLLCIMTQGESISQLQPVIQTISKRVFEKVKSRN